MNIKNIYPLSNNKEFNKRKLLNILRWPFILSAILSVIVNVIVGGVWWSVIVVMGLYMVWHLAIQTDLVEYNRISQFIKATIYSCVLMLLIDTFLISGWALDVISIVSFASVFISGVLLFTDLNRQKQNMLPIFYLILIAVIWSIIGLSTALEINSWSLIVLACITIGFLLAIIVVLRGDFIREIRSRFHLK